MERTVGDSPHPEGTRRVLGYLSPEFGPAPPTVRRTRPCYIAERTVYAGGEKVGVGKNLRKSRRKHPLKS